MSAGLSGSRLDVDLAPVAAAVVGDLLRDGPAHGRDAEALAAAGLAGRADEPVVAAMLRAVRRPVARFRLVGDGAAAEVVTDAGAAVLLVPTPRPAGSPAPSGPAGRPGRLVCVHLSFLPVAVARLLGLGPAPDGRRTALTATEVADRPEEWLQRRWRFVRLDEGRSLELCRAEDGWWRGPDPSDVPEGEAGSLLPVTPTEIWWAVDALVLGRHHRAAGDGRVWRDPPPGSTGLGA